jgi:hypothetical protein
MNGPKSMKFDELPLLLSESEKLLFSGLKKQCAPFDVPKTLFALSN